MNINSGAQPNDLIDKLSPLDIMEFKHERLITHFLQRMKREPEKLQRKSHTCMRSLALVITTGAVMLPLLKIVSN